MCMDESTQTRAVHFCSIRGSLGSILTISLNVGILIAYVTGAYLPYHIVPCVHIVFPILFFIGSLFLPETPQYLITHDRPEVSVWIGQVYRTLTRDSLRSVTA